MYCKYCGKVLEDDSMFCNHCGKSLGTNQMVSSKAIWVIYLIWVIANLYLFKSETRGDASRYFYPFTNYFYTEYDAFNDIETDIEMYNWNADFYDFSEFMVYVFILPALFYFIYKKNIKLINRKFNGQ